MSELQKYPPLPGEIFERQIAVCNVCNKESCNITYQEASIWLTQHLDKEHPFWNDNPIISVTLELEREGEKIPLGFFTTNQIKVGKGDLFGDFGLTTYKRLTKFVELLPGDKLTLEIE